MNPSCNGGHLPAWFTSVREPNALTATNVDSTSIIVWGRWEAVTERNYSIESSRPWWKLETNPLMKRLGIGFVPEVLTHFPLDKMAAILQTIFSDAFLWMKSFVFWLKVHRSLFLRVQLTISQHWFSYSLGAESATSHYLNQWWPDSLTHVCGTRGRWKRVWDVMAFSVFKTNYMKCDVQLFNHIVAVKA